MVAAMTRWKLIVLIAAGLLATERAPAAEMHVVSSDSNTHFIELGMAKAVLIELPIDMKDVIVADKTIVAVTVLSKRRVSIIGEGPGDTDVFFLDANGQQIAALDIAVASTAMAASYPAAFYHYPGAANKVVVFRGLDANLYSCTPDTCISTLTERQLIEAKTTREVCDGCGEKNK